MSVELGQLHRQEMVRQLAKPMKYKETAVIEMDMPEVEAE
jgi:hypothetical protein